MADARTVKSQQALIQSGLILLNKNKGISLSDIAKEANVGRATLYRLYDSKEALVEAIAVWCLTKFDSATQFIDEQARSHMQAIEMMFSALMPLTEEFRFIAELDYFAGSSKAIENIIEQQDKELIQLIDDAKQHGEIDATLPTTWLLHLINGLFFAGWYQQEQEGFSPADAAALAIESFKRVASPKT